MPITAAVGAPPFAGPVFTDWYWEPLFLLVLSAPCLAALAAGGGALATVRARRAGRQRTGTRIWVRVAASYLVLQLVVLLGWSVGWGQLSGWRRPGPLVAPAPRPVAPPPGPGYTVTYLPAPAGVLHAVYASGARQITLVGEPARRVVATQDCDLAGIAGVVRYRGLCRPVQTGGGPIALVPPGSASGRFYVSRFRLVYEVAWTGPAESDAFELAAALP